MLNVKFIGTSEKENKKRLYCQLHLTVAKGTYQTVKIPLKSLITGKPYVVRTEILSPNAPKGMISFVDAKKMKKEEVRTAKEIKELMSLMQLAINEIEDECSKENRVLLPTDFTYVRVCEIVKRLADIQQSPMVNSEGVAKEKREIYLDAYWEDFVEKIKEGKILHNGRRYKWNTIKFHQNSLRCFIAYQKTISKSTHLRFDEINRVIYDGFVSYMETKGECPNTIGGRIKNLKAIMHRARVQDNLHENILYEGFTVIKEEVDVIYLTEEELKKMYNLELEGDNAYLQKYRDIFLFGCYTGMRSSDLLNVKPSYFATTARGTKVLRYIPTKTKDVSQTPLSIPLNLWSECEVIAKRYEYNLPKVTEQNLREYIKKVGKLAEITDNYYVTRGSMKRDEPYQKHELITIHTARRTFCTLLYYGDNDLTEAEIMKMSGHTKESTFMKYIRATGDEVADKIEKKMNAKKKKG